RRHCRSLSAPASEMTDRSEAGADRDLQWRRQSVADMKAKFDPTNLTEDARLSYDIWELELKRAEEGARWRRHRYVFSRGSAQTGLPNFLINFHRVDEKADMEAYAKRVALIDDSLDQLLVRARAAAADGIHMPGFAYPESIDELRRVTTGAPFTAGKDSALFADAKAKIKALQTAGKLSAGEGKALEREIATAMTTQMRPAYERVAAFLTEDQPKAQTPDKQGALALPDGAKYYDASLYLQTTTALSAIEIHQIGLDEVKRIRVEMETLKAAVGFKGSLEEFFKFMRTDKRFYFPDNDAGAAEYIKQADAVLAAMKVKLPQYFGILPKADLVVKRVEAFREQPGAAQHYMSGTPDGSRPGVYYAHLSDMNAMPTYQLEVVAYHEGLPGHHMQISIQQELTGLPQFRTQYGYGAFSEGWGLYSEALAKEMGCFTDPYNDFGRLATEMWRAIRLVVDTGMHSKGWTQKQAEDYFLANSPQPAQAVKSEIERYILGPGQATSYKIGMITIQKLRDEAKAALGDKFDYRSFHDVVLGGGSLPMPVLEARVRRWIEKQKLPVSA
ncbi:MAG TPA: DUF885 domain-containing protein, partial [Steroidobacteraceae bacterium]|nr:DUF885 domain-containing protein [Steroidobacteraceae bacterium]